MGSLAKRFIWLEPHARLRDALHRMRNAGVEVGLVDRGEGRLGVISHESLLRAVEAAVELIEV